MSFFHEPVMCKEVLASLGCRPGGVYVDGTVGGGGHARAILEQTAPDGLLIGIDRDSDALRASEKKLQSFGRRKILVKGNFADIGKLLTNLNIEKVDGILLDLGVSSHQLDAGDRGFSFSSDAPLDMRMDQDSRYSACDLVNLSSENELRKIIKAYGEEPMAGRITRAILTKRAAVPIRTTRELADVIYHAVPAAYRQRRIHPATRTFQAIRIAVNDELSNLRTAILNGTDMLKRGGRFSIISFHSLEDRIVKEAFRAAQKGCTCPPDLPVCNCKGEPKLKVITKRPVYPGTDEVDSNPRARSARLRTAERR
ncbi:MAG: 16S rRNA (cytosine(1402)-N(4))-methyltransferase [Deltaproteobacteria bacterium HGW-Deltaproteobacteria-9]|nr:MAG: 16S rRNA (cytosine(1402)-N(4))-methyltransferase [Deltaproteobacteria bacterium HGW-Deltaproteobacteria-9]